MVSFINVDHVEYGEGSDRLDLQIDLDVANDFLVTIYKTINRDLGSYHFL